MKHLDASVMQRNATFEQTETRYNKLKHEQK